MGRLLFWPAHLPIMHDNDGQTYAKLIPFQLNLAKGCSGCSRFHGNGIAANGRITLPRALVGRGRPRAPSKPGRARAAPGSDRIRAVAQGNQMAKPAVDLPTSETLPDGADAAPGRRVSIIYNPAAGRRRRRTLGRVVKSLEAHGLDVSVAATSGPGDATRLARRAVSEGTDIVAAAGGDGTIREVVAGMIGGNALLGIVPMGTASVLASELRLPRRPEAIAAVITGGTARPLHVPRANGHPFLLMAGAGFDGAVVECVTPRLKRRFGKAAFVLCALRTWASGPRPRIRVEADGSVRHAEWVVVTNVSRYAGPYVLAPGASPQSQELAVCLFAKARPLALAGGLLRAVCGNTVRTRGLESLQAHDVALSAPDRVRVQIDGDTAGSLPLRLASTTERIRVLCPRACAFPHG